MRIPETKRLAGLPLLLAFLPVLLSGCGISHIEELRTAQDVFNQAADAENRQRLAGPDGLIDLAEASSGYRITAETVGALLDAAESREALRADNLLCTAYTLRALALWRLEDHEGALRAARLARGEDLGGVACPADGRAASIPPRERALLAALPALVRIEQASALRGNGEASLGDFTRIEELIADARGELGAARATVPANHPVQVYLLASELAAIRGWHSAVVAENLTRDDGRREKLKEAADAAKATLTEYAAVVCDRQDRLREEDLQPWMRVFGLESQVDDIVEDSDCPIE